MLFRRVVCGEVEEVRSEFNIVNEVGIAARAVKKRGRKYIHICSLYCNKKTVKKNLLREGSTKKNS